MEDKKNPVYANTSDIAAALQQHQQSVALSQAAAAASAAASAGSDLILGQQQPLQPSQPIMTASDLHQMETLKAENDRLRGQLTEYAKKIGRVASLEQEMAKIHQAYQSLLKHSEKKEMLEKSARAKLQAVIINLSDANKVLISNHPRLSPFSLFNLEESFGVRKSFLLVL